MRLDYLTTASALEYLRESHGRVLTLDGLRKRIQRGDIVTKQYVARGSHLSTRGELDRWARS